MKHVRLYPPVLLLVAGLIVPGCLHGPNLTTFEPARQPEGIHTTLRLSSDRGAGRAVAGELLAVREDGLVVRTTGEEILLVPFGHIQDGRFRQKNTLRIGAGRPPEAGKREQLRLLSRFPQGLGGAVLERLLALHGQTELKTIP